MPKGGKRNMYEVKPMVKKGELLKDMHVYDGLAPDEMPTTIPQGFIGDILGLTNSDCYVVYCGEGYDEVVMVGKDYVRVIDENQKTNMITWYYNRFGNVSIWRGEIETPGDRLDSDIYLQVDTDVESFFDHIGLKVKEVRIGDWDTCEDIGYFE